MSTKYVYGGWEMDNETKALEMARDIAKLGNVTVSINVTYNPSGNEFFYIVRVSDQASHMELSVAVDESILEAVKLAKGGLVLKDE